MFSNGIAKVGNISELANFCRKIFEKIFCKSFYDIFLGKCYPKNTKFAATKYYSIMTHAQDRDLKGNYQAFVKEISETIPADRIYTDSLRRYAWGTDAGFYRLTPKVVVRSDNEQEISHIMRTASRLNLPVTFRAAGTSLSGQSISDSVIIVAGKHWEKFNVNADGKSITLQPGIIGDKVNAILRPYGRKFGPDPASVKSCMVGGILMNNASGMSCGTVANSDKLLTSVRIVFADGTILDTADEQSRKAFASTHADFISEIEKIRDEVNADEELRNRIIYKYSIKNVTGLNIRPFVAYQDPFEIIAHLMAGSEGTLAFLSQVTMDTLPLAPKSASAMVYFHTMREANRVAVALKKINVSAAELLDSRSLASVRDERGLGKASLLIKVEDFDDAGLARQIEEVKKALAGYETAYPFEFTSDQAECARLWGIRSGIFPTVGSMRQQGTTCIIEDIAFHIEDLPDAIDEVSGLLDKYHYDDSCIYGHVLEGNVHFIINQLFDSDKEVERYGEMLRDIVKIVVDKYDGSLKAEHGTGRNMAPFVKAEWGEKAYSYMKRVKRLFDPQNILNPGVIFNDDPQCCYKNLKQIPVIAPFADAPEEAATAYARANKCIECGFCEVNCMSCGFTLSSRTRIAVQREISRLRSTGENPELLETLLNEYKYYGDDTCAGDGLCQTSCPMGISVADITHEIRRGNAGPVTRNVGEFAAEHLSGVKSMLRGVLDLASFGRTVLGRPAMETVAGILHKGGLPLWTESLPKAYKMPSGIGDKVNDSLKVVYFPSCINQTMGIDRASKGMRPLAEEMVALMQKAGYEVVFPAGRESLCCGTIWESKGMGDLADRKTRELEDALYEASEGGKYPVVCDQSPCVHRMKTKMTRVKVYDSVEFIWLFLKDRLNFVKVNEPVSIHLTCSTRLMKIDKMFYDLASLCASEVLVPDGVGCCGFAGDKGMTNPELNAYGLRKLRPQIEERGIKTGYSNSRTCEIGLQTNSGIPYRSIVYLVNQCTEAK